MNDPVISNVETIEHQDFESIIEDESQQRDDRDVVYMRLVTHKDSVVDLQLYNE